MSLYPKGAVISVPCSFETSLQAQTDVRFPGRVLCTKAKAVVTKALAGTDAGIVAIKNAAGATVGTITIPLSSALDVEVSVDLTANTIVEANSFLRVDPSKATAGGSCTVLVEYQNIGK